MDNQMLKAKHVRHVKRAITIHSHRNNHRRKVGAIVVNAKLVIQVHQDNPDATENREIQVVMVTQGHQAEMAVCCQPHHRSHHVSNVQQVRKVLPEVPDQKVYQVLRVTVEMQAPMDDQAHQVRVDHQVPKVRREFQVTRVQMASQAKY